MTWYNFTNMTDSNTTINILRFANEITGNWYGIMVIVGFFFVMFIALIGYGARQSLTVSSFITAIITILFRVLGLVSEKMVLLIVVFVAIGLISLTNWGGIPGDTY